jgi:AMP phosphorylase
MELTTELLPITSGGIRIAILNDETASSIGIHSSDRIKLSTNTTEAIAIANIANHFPKNRIGLYQEIADILQANEDQKINVQLAPLPESLIHVRAKVRGERLRETDIQKIVTDVVERHLSEVEIAAFLTALNIHGLSMSENEALSRSMVQTGKTLNFNTTPILDKHSIGGIPGDKTSIIVVPIIAAAGYTIPKTSSRAITSPAGTADRMETLAPVNLTTKEIQQTVKKTNACLVWGGSLELAPADDLFIKVEYPLGIDPMLLPSIMSKKKAIGATHVAIDIPTGSGAKIKTRTEAYLLASDFVDLGKRLGITIQCALTFGDQPVGCAIGPALEACEALSTLQGKGPVDLVDKATTLAGLLFEMTGVQNGKQKAEKILQSGKAEKKLRQIIEVQGGNSKIKAEEIHAGEHVAEVKAKEAGKVLWISTENLVQVARDAGAPKEKGAGVLLKAKLGDAVRKGTVLFQIHAERASKLESALQLAERLEPFVLNRKPEEAMLLDQVPAKVSRAKPFMLER